MEAAAGNPESAHSATSATYDSVGAKTATKRSALNWGDEDSTWVAKVAQLFNANQSVVFARDWEACKRKFTFLKAHKKPTGDPNCPPLVARAKRLQRELDCRAVVETMDDNGEISQHEGVGDDEIRMTGPDAIAHHGPYMPTSTVSSVEQTAMNDDDVSNVFAHDEEGCDGDEESPVTKRPRRLNPIQAEPPNRSGLSHDTLRLLGKRLIVDKFPNPPPSLSSSASSMSSVPKNGKKSGTHGSNNGKMNVNACAMNGKNETINVKLFEKSARSAYVVKSMNAIKNNDVRTARTESAKNNFKWL
ncbi:hypothetical protein H257_10813 [Aphanomyces astaci]|uniref:DUF6818 domain-containing protein n=1 Tax=Aphanomyces astaci TaxID=112090 RepID=W4G4R2_APHAT|nr:hypothetical protein H257_10813 [Aphanomyces astaci]ETV74697.1 hypothetical protein H257_10813 [Aphanomyces astaci]|eukprot:XP_009835784.1 hypothetical protein H257_10813 [Aphanomyces astaci]